MNRRDELAQGAVPLLCICLAALLAQAATAALGRENAVAASETSTVAAAASWFLLAGWVTSWLVLGATWAQMVIELFGRLDRKG